MSGRCDRWGARGRLVGSLILIVAVVGGGYWLKTRDNGEHWDDVEVGQCVSGFDNPVVANMMRGGHAANTALNCSSPKAGYVVVSHTFERTTTCADRDKGKTAFGRYVIKDFDGRHTSTMTFYGAMCLAPNLHVGSCYSPGSERGNLVAVSPECDLTTWQVTRRIAVSDINRCSPASGLVLRQPPVTYCEIVHSDPEAPEFERKHMVTGPPPGG
ncbi:hypothetical protein ACPXCG_20050 [Gordonia sp. DT218]|uniref:hypothetical protein n=1 Tax=unclassified Gordonia (in: high G+C Gram-positive bacteria) TaxID=2657482 RepID=UPI003CF6E560